MRNNLSPNKLLSKKKYCIANKVIKFIQILEITVEFLLQQAKCNFK